MARANANVLESEPVADEQFNSGHLAEPCSPRGSRWAGPRPPAVTREGLTDRGEQRHADEDEDAPEHVAVHLPLELAALVPGAAVVQQGLGFVSWG